jgi:transposase
MANRRFEMHEIRQVLVRMRMGESNRTIAKTGLIGRHKAAALRDLAQEHGWLEVDRPLPKEAELATHFADKPRTEATTSLIVPYHEKVKTWFEAGVQGTTIHQTLVNRYGFGGSYSSLRRYLNKLAEANPRVTTVIEFPPGDAAQIDFGAGPRIVDSDTGEIRKTWIFVMTLAWSRHMYAEFIWDQSVATWLACHRRAFEWFNGLPARVIIDNPKCAITKACYHDPEVQRAYADCAEGYGFLIAPCPVRDPQKKGRVESSVKYIKNAFVPLREFRSLVDANKQLKQWLMEVAGNRIHGTTREQPLKRFAETERHLLKPLPDVPPELAVWAKVKVHGDCHVQFEQCRYSTPHTLVHQSLWLRASDTSVRIYQAHELKAIHPRLKHPGDRSTLDAHLPPHALAYKMRDPQWCLKQATQIGEHCQRLIECLFNDKVLDNLRAAQGVVGLSKRYGNARVNAACLRALSFGNVRYRAVKQILEKGLDQQAFTETSFDTLADSYTGAGRFSRDPGTLLKH